MKSCKALFMSLALLVACATSSFATEITTVTPLNTSGDYYMGQPWSQTVDIAAGVTSAKLDMVVNMLGGSWNTSEEKKTLVYMSAASGTDIFFNNHPDIGSGTFTISSMFDISSGPGLYALKVIANDIWGDNNEAHWTINSATLTTTKAATPIPAAFLLLGSGLLGLFGVNKSRKLSKTTAV